MSDSMGDLNDCGHDHHGHGTNHGSDYAHHGHHREPIKVIDAFASRIKLWISTIILVCAAVAALTAASVRWVTNDVHKQIAETRQEFRAWMQYQQQRAYADSVRFDQGMHIMELAVIAIVEPQGSISQQAALDDLRGKRHFMPK